MFARVLAVVVLGGALLAAPARAEQAGGSGPAAAAAQAKISSGGLGTCAIAPTGVQCWGEGHDGQLLSGADDSRGDDPGEGPVPVFLGRGVQVASVSYGASHACAVDVAGAVYCWGRDIYGQLGDASRGNSVGDVPGERAIRVAVGPAAQVATGREHTCALLLDGSVSCWGGNVVGQLGRGFADDTGDAPGPVDLGGQKAIAIAARGSHSCVILESHALRCWGSNRFGESGVVPASPTDAIGDQPGEKPVAPTVLSTPNPLYRPVALALGESFTCVINGYDDVYCWGSGDGGALSTGNQNAVGDAPGEHAVKVAVGGGVKAIAAGSASACALRIDNELRCWGENTGGMLGNGLLPGGGNWGDGAGETTPLAVALGAGRTAQAISVGIRHTCALLTTGAPLCWGDSEDGQWGTGEEGGNNVKPQDRKAVTFSAGLLDGDADGLPDTFDACPAQAASTDDGCAPPVVPAGPPVQGNPPVQGDPPVVPGKNPPPSDWPVKLSAKKVLFDIALEPKKGKSCPSKATLKVFVELEKKNGKFSETAINKTVSLKKVGKGKSLRCRAKGTAKLKQAPAGGALVTAKFTGSGLKTQTVIAERVA